MPFIIDQPPVLWVPQKPALIRSGKDIKLPSVQELLRRDEVRKEANGAIYSAGPLQSIQFVSQTYVGVFNTTTCAYPAGFKKGDVAIFNIFNAQGVVPTDPSGWTRHLLTGTNAIYGCYRLLDGTEGATFSVASTATGYGHAVHCLLFRGVGKTITSVTPGSWTGNNPGSGTPTARTVTVSGNAPMLVLGHKCGSDNVLSMPMNPVADANSGNQVGDYDLLAAWKIYARGSTPVNNTVTGADDGANNCLSAGYFRFE